MCGLLPGDCTEQSSLDYKVSSKEFRESAFFGHCADLLAWSLVSGCKSRNLVLKRSLVSSSYTFELKSNALGPALSGLACWCAGGAI